MKALALLNLLNKLRKRDKMRGKHHILCRFPNSLNKFNNLGAGRLNSINHMTAKLIKNSHFGVKMSTFCHILCNSIKDIITYVKKIVNH